MSYCVKNQVALHRVKTVFEKFEFCTLQRKESVSKKNMFLRAVEKTENREKRYEDKNSSFQETFDTKIIKNGWNL